MIEPNSTIFRALTTLLHRPNVQEVLKEFPLVLARDTSDFALLLYLLRAEVLATRTPLTLNPRCCRVRSLTRSLSHRGPNNHHRHRHSPPLALATPATSFSLFRETTAPSLLLSSYAHLVGNEFFRQLLRPALEPVLHGAYSLDSQDVRRSRLLHQSATDTHAIPLLCAELNQYGVGDADATAALAIGGLALMRAGRGGRV